MLFVERKKKHLFPIICTLLRKCLLLIDSPFHLVTEMNWKLNQSLKSLEKNNILKYTKSFPGYWLLYLSLKAEAKVNSHLQWYIAAASLINKQGDLVWSRAWLTTHICHYINTLIPARVLRQRLIFLQWFNIPNKLKLCIFISNKACTFKNMTIKY